MSRVWIVIGYHLFFVIFLVIYIMGIESKERGTKTDFANKNEGTEKFEKDSIERFRQLDIDLHIIIPKEQE